MSQLFQKILEMQLKKETTPNHAPAADAKGRAAEARRYTINKMAMGSHDRKRF